MKKLTTAVAALLAAVMLAACGSSDSSQTGSAGASSQEETSQSAVTDLSEAESEEPAAPESEESIDESSEPAEPIYRSIKLMTMGDSITDGFWLQGGYRVFLCNKLEENGLSGYVDFVGSKKSGECYDNEHEGYTAYAIEAFRSKESGTRSGIAKFAPDKITEYQPDVLTLMIGTNDILSLYELDKAGDRLEALVDSCLGALPEGGKLFLASLPDMDANDDTYIDQSLFTPEFMDQCISEYNEKVEALVEKKQGEGKNIEFCDVHAVLDKSDLYDGVHPSEAGYQKLADYWYDVITKEITE